MVPAEAEDSPPPLIRKPEFMMHTEIPIIICFRDIKGARNPHPCPPRRDYTL